MDQYAKDRADLETLHKDLKHQVDLLVAENKRLRAVMTKDELTRIIYDEIKADVECKADAKNPFQEGYSVGFNDCRARVLSVLVAKLTE